MHIVLIDVFWQKFDEQVSIAALLLVRHPKCVHNLVQSGTHLKHMTSTCIGLLYNGKCLVVIY